MTIARFASAAVTLGVMLAAAILAGGCEPKPKKLSLSAYEQEALSQVTSVAVAPLADAPGSAARGSGTILAGAVSEQAAAPGIRVVERAQLAKLVEEHDLKALLGDNAKVADLGKQIGVDVVFVGEVSQYESKHKSSRYSMPYVGGSVSDSRMEHYVGLNVRAVRVSDGTVIYNRSGSGKDRGGFSPAAREAAEKALKDWRLYYQQKLEKQQAAPAAPQS